jgi:hypothetical protein
MLRAGINSLGTMLCQHEQPQRGREIVLLPACINLRNQFPEADLLLGCKRSRPRI